MNRKPRKGMHDVATRSSLTNSLENPQHAFLRMASLELKKTLCAKVREAAERRVVEMREMIAELEREQSRLLTGVLEISDRSKSRRSRNGDSTCEAPAAQPAGRETHGSADPQGASHALAGPQWARSDSAAQSGSFTLKY
jgi:hypothetical protein